MTRIDIRFTVQFKDRSHFRTNHLFDVLSSMILEILSFQSVFFTVYTVYLHERFIQIGTINLPEFSPVY